MMITDRWSKELAKQILIRLDETRQSGSDVNLKKRARASIGSLPTVKVNSRTGL